MAEAVRQQHSSGDGRKQPKQAQLEAKLLVVAVCVRLAYLALVATFWTLLDDYDTSANLLSDSCADNWPEEAASAQQYLPGVVWDSIFFHRIAACGYEYEQFFAFYPGLPGELPHLNRRSFCRAHFNCKCPSRSGSSSRLHSLAHPVC